jgi:hypothetical protein
MAISVRDFLVRFKITAVLPSIGQVKQLIIGLSIYNFSVNNDELDNIGIAFYPIGKLINHSCAPNAVASFTGKKLVIRAVRPIKKGEEIYISYLDIFYYSKKDRREELKNIYFFDCNCWLCETKTGKTIGNDEFNSGRNGLDGEQENYRIFSLYKNELKKLEKKNGLNDKCFLDSYIDRLANIHGEFKKILSPMHVDVFGTKLSYVKCLSIRGDRWVEAQRESNELISMYRTYLKDYGTQFHPSFAVQLVMGGRINSWVGDVKAAIDRMEEAIKIMNVTHGEDNVLRRETEMLLIGLKMMM